MKRTYSKPYLLVESFQLSASIATSCSSQGKTPLNFTISTCSSGDQDGEEYIDYLGNACDNDILGDENGIGGDDNDRFCYQGPFDPYGVFMNS